MSPEYQLFTEIVAKHAAEAKNAGERYALGSKSVAIPINQSLMLEFVNALNAQHKTTYPVPTDDASAVALAVRLGLVSETGAKSGVIECRLPNPPFGARGSINTGSTIQLAREMEAHLSLVLYSLQKATKNNEGFPEIKKEMFAQLNHEILLEQMQWLLQMTNRDKSSIDRILREYASLDNQTLALKTGEFFREFILAVPNGKTAFNDFLARSRIKLAEKYRQQMVHLLFTRGLVDPTDPNIDKIIKDTTHQLAKTPSTQSDALFQNSATGKFFTTTATNNVAHDKQLGADKVAAVRVDVNGKNVVWRTPSIAATDAYKKTGTLSYSERTFIDDVKEKLDYLSTQILDSRNGGNPEDYVYYNLLTSYGCTRLADNHQSWSTRIIIQGVHEHNRGKLSGAHEKDNNYPNDAAFESFVLLTNLSVNQWGLPKKVPPEKDPSKREPIDEVHDLADLSILQLLKKQLCTNDSSILNEKARAELISCADTAMRNYRQFLRSGTTPYYTYDEHSSRQREAIDNFRKNINLADISYQGKERPETPEQPEQKASRVILKMFMNGTYALKEYGMLMQALLVAVETNKMSGCKSANERFASVLDKSVNVSDPKFLHAMDQFIAGLINESQLYSVMVECYNQNNVYEGPGQDCSIRDQGATAKAGKFAGGAVAASSETISFTEDKSSEADPWADDDEEEEFIDQNKNESYDTNLFEPRTVTNLDQKGAKKLQAHNVEDAVQLTMMEDKKAQLLVKNEKGALVIATDIYSREQHAKKAPAERGESSSSSVNWINLKKQLSAAVYSHASEDKQREREFKEGAGLTLYSCAQYIQQNTPPNMKPLTPEIVENIRAIHIVVTNIQDEAKKIAKTDLHALIPRVLDLCKAYETAFQSQQSATGPLSERDIDRANNIVDEIKNDYPHPSEQKANTQSFHNHK